MFVILMFARKWVGWYRLLRYRKAFSLPGPFDVACV